ncbi:MAG: LON peptidase substrate-binding domain-containing protein, partial [Flavobacteriales bacterium]
MHPINEFTATRDKLAYYMSFENTEWLVNQEPQEGDFIPLISSEDEEAMNKEKAPENIPILPLKNTVLFPGVVIPITVGRDRSIRLINEANKTDKIIGVVSQVDGAIEEPNPDDLNKVGTVANIVKMLKMPDGNTTVIIQGKKRFEWTEMTQIEPFMRANIVEFDEAKSKATKDENRALHDSLKELALKIIQQSPNIPSEAGFAIKNIDSLSFLVNFISSNMNAEVHEKQALLQITDLKERAEKVLQMLNKELQMLELKNDIQDKVKTDLDKQQREFFLHQQMKQIQEELGNNPSQAEIIEKKKKGAEKNWPKNIAEAFEKEIKRFERMNPQSAEYSVQANYIDLMLDLPWNETSNDN